MADKVYLSAPIAKTVETPDGGREVWGFATLEVPDKVGEIADFEGTVKAFEKWSSEIEKRTQGKSKGNVRVMHGATVAGKAIHWEPTETTVVDEDGNPQTVKAIWTGAYVPPTKPDIIKDIDEGILSAFSIGGSYQKRWWDDTAKAFRFIPELSEYSLVDNPCVPGADITQVISKAVAPWNKDERNIGGEMVEDDLGKSLESVSDEQLEAELAKRKSSANDKLHEDAKKRAEKYGISFKEGKGHLTPPAGKPTNADEYGDPTNYAYPIDGSHIKAAVSYFNQDGQREDGDYSEAEWAKIGKRIAEAASKLEGGEYKFKDGKIETPSEKKGAEKSLTAEEIQKAASEAGITMEQLHAVFKALNPEETTPAPTNVTTVDGDGDGDHNKEFPNPPDGDEKVDIEGGESEVKASENETADKAADTEELAKAGKAVSKHRMTHMKHAMGHIKAAMDGSDYGPDHHMQVENDTAGDGPNSGEEAPQVTSKSFTSELHKSLGVFVSDEVSKALAGVKSEVQALVKGLPNAEAFEGLKKQLDDMGALVKAIHETPQPGGPVLGKGSPDFVQLLKSGQADVKQASDDQLDEFVKSIKDPIARDHASQELARRRMAAVYGGNA